MAKEASAFLRAEIGDNATNTMQEARDRMLGGLAQMRLEFAEGQLDRIEIRRILREIDERRASSFDCLRDAGDLVDRQMVHEHDLAALEGRDKTLPDIGKKHRPVHGAFNHKRCGHSASSQT